MSTIIKSLIQNNHTKNFDLILSIDGVQVSTSFTPAQAAPSVLKQNVLSFATSYRSNKSLPVSDASLLNIDLEL